MEILIDHQGQPCGSTANESLAQELNKANGKNTDTEPRTRNEGNDKDNDNDKGNGKDKTKNNDNDLKLRISREDGRARNAVLGGEVGSEEADEVNGPRGVRGGPRAADRFTVSRDRR